MTLLRLIDRWLNRRTQRMAPRLLDVDARMERRERDGVQWWQTR